MVVALVVVATSCRILPTPTDGFLVLPDRAVAGRKVLVLGDSLVRQPSLSFGVGLEPAGAEVLIEATNTGGLVSGPVRWDDRARELLASFGPSHVVIGFHGSFAPPYWPPYAPPGTDGSPAWTAWVNAQPGTAEFAQRNLEAVRSLTRVFVDAGVQVTWVQPLPFPPQYGSPSVPERLWGQWASMLATEFPAVRRISANGSIAGSAGQWVDRLWFCGELRWIRSTAWDGGVHLTADGAGRYGRALAREYARVLGWAPPVANCGD